MDTNVNVEEKTTSCESQTEKLFFQLVPDKTIKIAPNTNVIKAQDSANYFSATSLLEEANTLLEKTKKQAIQIELEAHAKGYKEGLNKANDLLAEQRIKTKLEVTDYLAGVESELSNIVLTIVRKILNDYDAIDYVMQNISAALKNFQKSQNITLHINDSLFQEISEHLNNAGYTEDKINLIPDANLNKKDCLVITELGIINASLDHQLKTIKESLTQDTSTSS